MHTQRGGPRRREPCQALPSAMWLEHGCRPSSCSCRLFQGLLLCCSSTGIEQPAAVGCCSAEQSAALMRASPMTREPARSENNAQQSTPSSSQGGIGCRHYLHTQHTASTAICYAGRPGWWGRVQVGLVADVRCTWPYPPTGRRQRCSIWPSPPASWPEFVLTAPACPTLPILYSMLQ